MSEQKHTPTPWRVLTANDGLYVARDTAEAEPIAEMTCNGACEDEERDAAYIVRAVNERDDLIAFVLNVCTAGERIGQQWDGVTMSNQARELAYRLKLAETEG